MAVDLDGREIEGSGREEQLRFRCIHNSRDCLIIMLSGDAIKDKDFLKE
jgi:hypothetical protein